MKKRLCLATLCTCLALPMVGCRSPNPDGSYSPFSNYFPLSSRGNLVSSSQREAMAREIEQSSPETRELLLEDMNDIIIYDGRKHRR